MAHDTLHRRQLHLIGCWGGDMCYSFDWDEYRTDYAHLCKVCWTIARNAVYQWTWAIFTLNRLIPKISQFHYLQSPLSLSYYGLLNYPIIHPTQTQLKHHQSYWWAIVMNRKCVRHANSTKKPSKMMIATIITNVAISVESYSDKSMFHP